MESKTAADESCSVRVAVRIRPLVSLETAQGCGEAIHAVPGKPQVLAGEKSFTLDHVYGPGPRTTQALLYDQLAKPLLHQVFKGCVRLGLACVCDVRCRGQGVFSCFVRDECDTHCMC